MRDMKDSGVAWIGAVPSDYGTASIGSLFTIKKDIIGREPETVLSITQAGIRPKDLSSNEGQNASSYAHYQVVNVGDFAMNHMDLLTGWIDISKYEGVTSPDYRVFTLNDKEMSADYFLRVFQYYYTNKVFFGFGQGVATLGRWRLPAINFKKIDVPVPPVPEQRRIVAAIDDSVGKVDALISNVQNQIEKLKTFKQSLITEVVTKGLDPTMPMKDSGVEWIGEIPKHWNVAKARRIITSTQNGMTRRDLTESKGQIVLKLKNISADGSIDYSCINRIALSEKEKETYALQDGDFLFVRVNGSKGLVGKCAIFEDNGEITAYNDHIIRVRINTFCCKEYFHYYLLSGAGKTEIEHHTSTSAGQYTISGEGLRDIWLVLPPKDIQENLCSFLDEKCSKIDRLIALKQAKIEKLEQYKRSLIYEYVTGKRDVI